MARFIVVPRIEYWPSTQRRNSTTNRGHEPPDHTLVFAAPRLSLVEAGDHVSCRRESIAARPARAAWWASTSDPGVAMRRRGAGLTRKAFAGGWKRFVPPTPPPGPHAHSVHPPMSTRRMGQMGAYGLEEEREANPIAEEQRRATHPPNQARSHRPVRRSRNAPPAFARWLRRHDE